MVRQTGKFDSACRCLGVIKSTVVFCLCCLVAGCPPPEGSGQGIDVGPANPWTTLIGTTDYHEIAYSAIPGMGGFFTEIRKSIPRQSGSDSWIVKVAKDGKELWSSRIGTNSGVFISPFSWNGIFADPNGQCYTATLMLGGMIEPKNYVEVSKISDQGVQLWRRKHAIAGTSFINILGGSPLPFLPSPSGGYFLADQLLEIDNKKHVAISKISDEGLTEWTCPYLADDPEVAEFPNLSQATLALAGVRPSGNLVLIGLPPLFSTPEQRYVEFMEIGQRGEATAVRTFQNDDVRTIGIGSYIATPDGGFLLSRYIKKISGETFPNIAKLRSDFSEEWLFPYSYATTITSIALRANGGVAVSANEESVSGSIGLLIVLGSNGIEEFRKEYRVGAQTRLYDVLPLSNGYVLTGSVKEPSIKAETITTQALVIRTGLDG